MKSASRLPHFECCFSKERRIKINDQVSLKLFEFTPKFQKGDIPVVIVTGLATMIDSFSVIIQGLARVHPVYYLETRDKTSSHTLNETNFSIQIMGRDVSGVIEILNFKEKGYSLIGYSLGSAVIADGYRFLGVKPRNIIFMEPTVEFNYPGWSLFLIRHFGVLLYSVLKKAAKRYLLSYIINENEDRQMMVISFNSLDHADPAKVRNAVLSVAGYKIWDRLPEITCPSLVVGTSKDGLHRQESVKRMVEMLVNGIYVDLETNERTHSLEMVELTINFIRNSENAFRFTEQL